MLCGNNFEEADKCIDTQLALVLPVWVTVSPFRAQVLLLDFGRLDYDDIIECSYVVIYEVINEGLLVFDCEC